MIKSKTPKIIAFDRRKLFGDIMVSIPALYLAKRIYPSAKLILITNARGKNLCKNFDFIDKIVELEVHSNDFGVIIEKSPLIFSLLGIGRRKIWTLHIKANALKLSRGCI